MEYSEDELMLVHHGGKCCGIKTIYGFGVDLPEHVEVELGMAPFSGNSECVSENDRYCREASSEISAFPFARPEETKLERLDAYLDYLRDKRPGGLVEVALAGSQLKGPWPEILEERGFVAVNQFKNSNSRNNVVVYHLVMKGE